MEMNWMQFFFIYFFLLINDWLEHCDSPDRCILSFSCTRDFPLFSLPPVFFFPRTISLLHLITPSFISPSLQFTILWLCARISFPLTVRHEGFPLHLLTPLISSSNSKLKRHSNQPRTITKNI